MPCLVGRRPPAGASLTRMFSCLSSAKEPLIMGEYLGIRGIYLDADPRFISSRGDWPCRRLRLNCEVLITVLEPPHPIRRAVLELTAALMQG